MEVFVANYPVFDARKRVYGYHLDFRSGFEEFYDSVDSEKAKVDFQALANFTDLVGQTKGFITFSRELFLKGFPALLSNETLNVVLPAGMDDDPEVLDACEAFHEAGYVIVLDDFALDRRDSPLLEYAEFVQIDPTKTSAEERQELCKDLNARSVRPLAKQVDTAEDFDLARAWGFSHFQGHFFTQPVFQPGKKIATNKISHMRVLKEVNAPELDYDGLDELVRQDVSMTYALLRFINSAWFGLRQEVRSIRHALVLLGPTEVRIWASLLVLRSLGDDKPHELFRRSLARAKIAEGIGQAIGMKDESPELFLMGMFSVIDALTDIPMAKALQDLPIAENIKQALLAKPGKYRMVFETILAYEKGQWDQFSSYATALGLSEEIVPAIFVKSLKWADDALTMV